jgi:NTE family protein
MAGLGLVLAGGAARGAYESGVLRYLFGEFAHRHGPVWPSVVSGTSVGAMNGTFVAAREPAGIEWLARTWRELEIPQVFELNYSDLFRAMRSAFSDVPFAMADPRPLQRLVARNFPTEALRRAIHHEGVRWLVGTTDLSTGRQVLFYDAREPPDWIPRPGVRVIHTRIKPIHTLASAALPLLFPPIALAGSQLVDGGLRQNTPLGPVLRAGADRVLVVSLKRQSMDDDRQSQPPEPHVPRRQDLERPAAGPGGAGRVRRAPGQRHRGLGASGPMARASAAASTPTSGCARSTCCSSPRPRTWARWPVEIYRKKPPNVSGAVAQLLERAAGRTGPDSDLLSYVYFDRAYTGALEQLGFEDARRREPELAAFLLRPQAP